MKTSARSGVPQARLPDRDLLPHLVRHADLRHRLHRPDLVLHRRRRQRAARHTRLEGVDYFAYVLLGWPSTITCRRRYVVRRKIRSEQTTGTLEAMLVTPTSTGTIVLGSSLWDFLLTSVKVIVYLAVGRIFFGW